jgi:protease IV
MRFLLNVTAAFLGVIAAFVFVFFFMLAVFVALAGAQGSSTSVPAQSVLVLDLGGTLPETQPSDPFAELFSGRTLTVHDVTEALEKAAADDRISAVWLKPSGLAVSWSTASEVRRALVAYRASGKPLIASPGDGGFSEVGYYLASAADSVFSPPEAPFELNGLFVATPFFGGTLDRLGIEPIVVRAGDFKSAAETITERGYSPENRQQVRALLEAFDDAFRSALAESRPVSRERLDALVAAGGVYTARAAAEVGLLDGLRYESQTEAALRTHTRQSADEELQTVSLRRYARVPRGEAGLPLGPRDRRVTVIHAVGTILPGESRAESGLGEILGSDTFVETVREAVRDERTQALVIRVDSPGGSASASDAMWAAVREAGTRMPVVVSMGSVAASGGYYLAAPAHAIVADPTTVTGSIGVISVFFDATDFLDDRLGIRLDTLRTGPAAGLYAVGTPLTDLERQMMEAQTAQIYQTFVERVAEGRRLPADSVLALGGGRVYSGREALAVGLVDELGDLRHAIRLAAERAGLAEGDYRIQTVPEPRPLLERIQESLDRRAMAALTRGVGQTPEERFVLRQAALLGEAARLHGVPQMRLLSVPEIR